MTIVLLVDGAPACAPKPHRCGWYERARTRTHAFELDRRLAAGIDPDIDPLLSLRAQYLIRPKTRHRLARRLRGVVRDARYAFHPFDASVPLARHEILRSRERIEWAAGALERPGPLDTRGVAALWLLLVEGTSPLYRPEAQGELAPLLEAAIEHLELAGMYV